MKKTGFLFIFLLYFCPVTYSQDAYIDYLEGEVYIRDKAGYIEEAFIDDTLETGYTVISGPDGFVEIYIDTTLIRLDANTVFQLQDKEVRGVKTNIFSCVAGSVFLKVESLAKDQLDFQINTPSANCGVRGTAFTIFTSADGSSLIAVEEGMVAVESKGVTIELAIEEGVEIKPGETPGEKFKVLRGELDFSTWEQEKTDDFLADPLSAIAGVENTLLDLIDKLTTMFNAYTEKHNQLNREKEKYLSFSEDQKEEKKEFDKKILRPLQVETSNLFLNVRYYTLSALSLRRYVLGRMYIIMKINSIKNLDNQVFQDFLTHYKNILTMFETHIVPHLVEADI